MKTINTRVEAEQLQNLLKSSKTGILLSLLLGLSLVLIYQTSSNSLDYISIWFILLLFAALYRIVLIIKYQRLVNVAPVVVSVRLRNMRLGAFVSGMIWGLAGILFFSANNSEQLIFLIFILTGLTAGNTVSNAADLVSGIGFSILAIAPITLLLLTSGAYQSVMMGTALTLYIIFMIMVLRYINTSTNKNIIMQLEAQMREKEAAKSEEHYRLILQHTPAGIWVQIKICTKADTDPLLWLNSSFSAPSGTLSA